MVAPRSIASRQSSSASYRSVILHLPQSPLKGIESPELEGLHRIHVLLQDGGSLLQGIPLAEPQGQHVLLLGSEVAVRHLKTPVLFPALVLICRGGCTIDDILRQRLRWAPI